MDAAVRKTIGGGDYDLLPPAPVVMVIDNDPGTGQALAGLLARVSFKTHGFALLRTAA